MPRNNLILSLLLSAGFLLAACDSNKTESAITAETVKTPPTKQQIITQTGVGSVQLGMGLDEAIATLPDASSKTSQEGEGITWTDIQVKGETLMSVLLDDDHSISLIRVLSPQFATEQGVAVGDKVQVAADKLGGLISIDATEIEAREFANFQNIPPQIQFQVAGKDGTAGVYADGETTTSVASPTATIQSIWIMED